MPSNVERQTPSYLEFVIENLLFRIEKGVKPEGLENIPQHGPAIIVINHMGWAEFLLPIIYLSQLPMTMIKAHTLEYPIVGDLARQLGVIPVKRGEPDRQALEDSLAVLRRRGFFSTFPEGTRGRDRDGTRKQLKQAKNGALYLAKKAAGEMQQPVPISPWAVWGSTEGLFPEIDDKDSSLRHRLRFNDRGPIYLKVAPAFSVSPPQAGELLTHTKLQPLSDAVMIAMRDMLPERYAGYYAGKIASVPPGGIL